MSEYKLDIKEKDLQENKLVRIDIKNKPIVLTKVSGKVYAMDAVCSHEGGPLEDGNVEGYNLTCPWHYAVFDIRNAKVSDQTVWATDLTSYPVKIEQQTGDILLSLESSSSPSSLSSNADEEQKQGLQQATESAVTTTQGSNGGEKIKKAKSEFDLTLLDKHEHSGTDIMSFRFSKQDNLDKNTSLDYILVNMHFLI
jgi:nitrite reductase/ring-hydroxylating ferredoxin subunit